MDNPIVGIIGVVLVVASIIALVVTSAKKKRQEGEETPAPKAKKAPKATKTPKPAKSAKPAKNGGFAVPGKKPTITSEPDPAPAPAAGSDRQPAPSAAPVDGGHQLAPMGGGATTLLQRSCLRYAGNNSRFPAQIPVDLQGGEFTIGRVDINLGPGRSSFEFPADTDEVSRHHAAITQDGEGYIIRDNSSLAGTYVNGMKLEPQVLYRLENGASVSFGRAGADYVWEETGSSYPQI